MEDGEQRFWTYKFAGKKLSYLDQNITNVVFSADSKKLVYSYLYSDGRVKINQSDIEGKNYQEIADLPGYSVGIFPVDDNLIYLGYISDADDSNGGVYSLKIKDKELKLLDDKKFSNIFSISLDKKKIFFIQPTAENDQIVTLMWTSDLDLKGYRNVAKATRYEFDYSSIVWGKDQKSVFMAAKNIGAEFYDRIYQVYLDGTEPKLLLKDDQGVFETIAVNTEGDRLYYLLNGQLYAAKI
jgi:hypothetical protein